MKQNISSEGYRAQTGQRFRCLICGAEALVIKSGNGKLQPKCCNQVMVLLSDRAQMFRCSVCGSEAAVINYKTNNLRLVCCNREMKVFQPKTTKVA